ncbi:hypothetical protein CR513_41544, partial [Mucuna pruriens]
MANKAKKLEKFFVKAFHKGLRVGQFSDSIILRRPASIGEIRTQTEKHIEAEEDLADRLQVEHKASPFLSKGN